MLLIWRSFRNSNKTFVPNLFYAGSFVNRSTSTALIYPSYITRLIIRLPMAQFAQPSPSLLHHAAGRVKIDGYYTVCEFNFICFYVCRSNYKL